MEAKGSNEKLSKETSSLDITVKQDMTYYQKREKLAELEGRKRNLLRFQMELETLSSQHQEQQQRYQEESNAVAVEIEENKNRVRVLLQRITASFEAFAQAPGDHLD